jgi:hypothetical protein
MTTNIGVLFIPFYTGEDRPCKLCEEIFRAQNHDDVRYTF